MKKLQILLTILPLCYLEILLYLDPPDHHLEEILPVYFQQSKLFQEYMQQIQLVNLLMQYLQINFKKHFYLSTKIFNIFYTNYISIYTYYLYYLYFCRAFCLILYMPLFKGACYISSGKIKI